MFFASRSQLASTSWLQHKSNSSVRSLKSDEISTDSLKYVKDVPKYDCGLIGEDTHLNESPQEEDSLINNLQQLFKLLEDLNLKFGSPGRSNGAVSAEGWTNDESDFVRGVGFQLQITTTSLVWSGSPRKLLTVLGGCGFGFRCAGYVSFLNYNNSSLFLGIVTSDGFWLRDCKMDMCWCDRHNSIVRGRLSSRCWKTVLCFSTVLGLIAPQIFFQGHAGAAIACGSLLLKGVELPESLTRFVKNRKSRKSVASPEYNPVEMARERFEVAANAGCDIGLK
ncbi:hypothetical protein CASFOL_008090 [Castilleja foliolosa]|uniref:Uncharacterized protein n=1 Tax=Castilleja foliolosa TaxID=1961234 RepID=A0ABD3DZX6_9LAMI